MTTMHETNNYPLPNRSKMVTTVRNDKGTEVNISTVRTEAQSPGGPWLPEVATEFAAISPAGAAGWILPRDMLAPLAEAITAHIDRTGGASPATSDRVMINDTGFAVGDRVVFMPNDEEIMEGLAQQPADDLEWDSTIESRGLAPQTATVIGQSSTLIGQGRIRVVYDRDAIEGYVTGSNPIALDPVVSRLTRVDLPPLIDLETLQLLIATDGGE